MIEEIGTVSGFDDEYVLVETKIKTTCSSCHAKENCGTSLIAKIFNPKPELLKLRSPVDLKIGQQVKLGIPEETIVNASALVYMLPLVVFIASVSIFQVGFAVHELLAFALSLGIGAITYKLVSFYLSQQKTSAFAPIIMGAVNQNTTVQKHEIPAKKLD